MFLSTSAIRYRQEHPMRELRPTYRFLEKTLLAAVMVSVLATPPMLLGGDFLRGDANRDLSLIHI